MLASPSWRWLRSRLCVLAMPSDVARGAGFRPIDALAVRFAQKHSLSAAVMDDFAKLCGSVALNATAKTLLSVDADATVDEVKRRASEFVPWRARTLAKKAAVVEAEVVRPLLPFNSLACSRAHTRLCGCRRDVCCRALDSLDIRSMSCACPTSLSTHRDLRPTRLKCTWQTLRQLSHSSS
jgi:hypothetical protein